MAEEADAEVSPAAAVVAAAAPRPAAATAAPPATTTRRLVMSRWGRGSRPLLLCCSVMGRDSREPTWQPHGCGL
ncbi:hypothetical protein GCM10009579_23690 [Streptomyces javensis]|uniref:Uncharacterized protein n=1 Tax=Streptomyces javensis TaxID=114698 RepID=A0ABN1WTH5_9ACTN